jgi:hypothetical protein
MARIHQYILRPAHSRDGNGLLIMTRRAAVGTMLALGPLVNEAGPSGRQVWRACAPAGSEASERHGPVIAPCGVGTLCSPREAREEIP